MKKFTLSALALAAAASSVLAPINSASAQYYDGRPPRWDHRGPPPPPPRDYHHHHDNTGRVIAGGLAAGVIGGLIGGAIANNNNGPRYVEEPPPPPRCWFEDRRVQNAYNGGSHFESVRVCR